MKRLENKIAVVTGGSKGIGAAIAKQLAAEGASVVVNYSTSKEGADKVVGEIVALGGKAIAAGADISKESDIARLFELVKKHYGRVDVLVNNAGVAAFTPLEGVTSGEYQRIFDTNVRVLLLVTKAASPLFPESGGSIVNISSVMSTMAAPMMSVYAGAKGAVDSITKVLILAKELAPRKIRVNAINPGYVHTEGAFAAGIPGSETEKRMIAMIPLGRPGLPADIALPAAFLASEDARYITGETLYVSGGAGT